MSSGNLLVDELIIPDAPARPGHSTDSSRNLLELLRFSRQAKLATSNSETIEGVIPKSVLKNLLSALRFRNAPTVRHSRRVAVLCAGMAHYLGWEEHQQRVLEIAALLHDVGKIGVPDNILLKSGKLSPDEANLMALHHSVGLDVLQALCVGDEVLEIIEHSRKNAASANGHRTLGSDVHQGARILAVADAYDSLSSDQTYRAGMPHEEIIETLSEVAGTQFDGNIICALARWVEQDGPPFAGMPSESDDTAPGVDATEALEASFMKPLCHVFSYLYLLESLYDGFCLIDSDHQFVTWNLGLERLLGQPAESMLRRVWTSRLVGYCDETGECLSEEDCAIRTATSSGTPMTSHVQMRRADGKIIEVEVQTIPLFDDRRQLQGVAEIFRDLTPNNDTAEDIDALRLAARRDPLTSIPNRAELKMQLQTELKQFQQQPNSRPAAVLFADIDRFKQINDTLGHTVGDNVLVEVARVLQKETYSGELVCRYGGEEFVVLCPETSLEHAVQRAERLRLHVSNCVVEGIEDRSLTASFGVTVVEPGDTEEKLLHRADTALYQAKQSGRNKTCSLTNDEYLSLGKSHDSESAAVEGMQLKGTFEALIAADMVVYKLGGFVQDERCKLVKVTPQRALIRMGDRGLFGRWGQSASRQPVEVEVVFSDAPSVRKRNATALVQVDVTIRPLGHVRDQKVFERRARMVLKTLRSFFAAN